MFFDNAFGLVRIVVLGTFAYVALIVLLRTSGKRTLSKFNMFDLIITVAFGSTFATVLLSETVALAEGVTALALLVALQFAVAWLSQRSSTVEEMVKGEPALLFHRGRYLDHVLRYERVTQEEVRQVVRQQGRASMDGVEAVVLETDGSMSVITSGPGPLLPEAKTPGGGG